MQANPAESEPQQGNGEAFMRSISTSVSRLIEAELVCPYPCCQAAMALQSQRHRSFAAVTHPSQEGLQMRPARVLQHRILGVSTIVWLWSETCSSVPENRSALILTEAYGFLAFITRRSHFGALLASLFLVAQKIHSSNAGITRRWHPPIRG